MLIMILIAMIGSYVHVPALFWVVFWFTAFFKAVDWLVDD